MDVRLLLDAKAMIGESPTWVASQDAVYWIDVKAPALHRLALSSGSSEVWPLPGDIGAFAFARGHQAAVVALRNGIFRLDLQTRALELLARSPFDPALHRFNEGACDSNGRLWIGTMFDPVSSPHPPPEPASLRSFTLSGGLRHEPDAAELHNGMAWSPDERTFFLSHSQQHTVFAFPFDAAAGRIGSPRTFATTPESLGLPDGAAVDAEGGYWCALHGGWRLHRYLADGRFDQEIELPVSQPTMCAFVGRNLELMVVTSATDKLNAEQLAREPHAGGLFCFQPRVPGVPRHCIVA
jgi:sugar lactone lactonase YvrE